MAVNKFRITQFHQKRKWLKMRMERGKSLIEGIAGAEISPLQVMTF